MFLKKDGAARVKIFSYLQSSRFCCVLMLPYCFCRCYFIFLLYHWFECVTGPWVKRRPFDPIEGMALDSLVESVTTYRLRPTWQHLYAGPFAVLYLVVFGIWTSWGFDEHYELGCIGFAAVGLLQVKFWIIVWLLHFNASVMITKYETAWTLTDFRQCT